MPYIPYLLLHILSFLVLAGLGAYSLRFRKVPAALYFGIAMMITAFLVLTFTMEINSTGLEEKVLWRRLFFIPAALDPVAFLVMAVYYIGRARWLSRGRIAALMAIPAVTIILALTGGSHSLLRYGYHIDSSGPFPILLWTNGPWFWVHIAFTYTLFALTLAILAWFIHSDHPRYYRQTLIVMMGFIVPLLADMLFVVWNVTPMPGYNPSVLFSAVSGLIVAYGIFHYRIMDIVPVARSRVVDLVSDPLLVLDARDRIVDFNHAMQDLSGLPEPLAIGQNASFAMGGILSQYMARPSSRKKIVLGGDGREMIFDLTISPFKDDGGDEMGRIVLFHDIGEIERAKELADRNARQLSEANQKLQKEMVVRKAAELALRRSEERLRLTLDAVNEGVWDWNIPAGDMVFSPRWYTMLGYKPYQFPQSYASWWRLVHPDDVGTLERTIKEHIAGSESFWAETRMMSGSGQWCWVLIRGQVIEKDRDGRPVRMLGTLSDITERRIADDTLKASLSEKEALLKEIHHRVKNNLQVIVSMLSIQSRRTKEDGARRALADCQNRVKSMALVHENLYRSDDLASVNFGKYVKSLASFLLGSYRQDAQRISLKISLDDVFLQIDQAIPCGLIINELVTNCIKHAFPAGMDGEIQIEGHTDGDTAVLRVRDNGIGLPADISPESNGSFGLKLIDTLVKQLKGTMDVDSGCGTEFTITFSTGSASRGGISRQASGAVPGKLPPGI